MNKKRTQIIIIPAYRPTNTLVSLIDELKNHFYKIIVIDDGGGEEYADIFRQIEQMKTCIVIRHFVNLGKGRALKTAFNYCLSMLEEARAGVVTVDADGQHKCEDILRICDAMDCNPGHLVLGSRSFDDKNIPFRSRFGNKLSKSIYGWLCGLNISDTQTGLRGIPYEFIGSACQTEGERYEYETNMLLAAKDKKIPFIEVDIATVYENNNLSSHFNPFKDSLKIYSMILKYSASSLFSVVIDYFVFGILAGNGLSILASTYIARGCSSLINFGINRNVVFKYKGNFYLQLVKYFLLVVVSGTISGVCVANISTLFGISAILVKVIVDSTLYFVNYYIQRKYVFTVE